MNEYLEETFGPEAGEKRGANCALACTQAEAPSARRLSPLSSVLATQNARSGHMKEKYVFHDK